MDVWTEYEKENRLSPHSREEGSSYCEILVIDGYSKWDSKFWWWMLEGETMLCLVKYRYGTKEIEEFYPCRMTGTKVYYGRGITPDCCIIV